MKRAILLTGIIIMLLPKVSLAEITHYIKRGTFTKIVTIKSKANHADDFLTVNVFFEMGKTIQWEESTVNISYRYLGIDNHHNLHIMRIQHDDVTNGDDVCNLIFEMNADNSGEITLIGQRPLKELLLIKLQVKATNSGLQTQYLGDLPVYQEK